MTSRNPPAGENPAEPSEDPLPQAEFERRIRAPLDDDEVEEVAGLVRWFTRRYPTVAERFAYVRRAWAHWTRPTRLECPPVDPRADAATRCRPMEDLDAYIIEALHDYDPERIIVYGSHARGTAGPDSDVDLLVIKDDPRRVVERIRDAQARLYRRELRDRWRALPPFDVLVCTPAELRERLALGDRFFQAIVRDGRTILERKPDAA